MKVYSWVVETTSIIHIALVSIQNKFMSHHTGTPHVHINQEAKCFPQLQAGVH